MEYANELKVKDALQLYFSKYHFENGGYDLKWFRIKIGPLFIPLPNTRGRIAAVKIHDLHHIATEYPATLRGEAEIGGWEIGSGCGKYTAAWVLNTGSFFYGMLFFPRRLYKAFILGRQCRPSLYYNTVYDDQLLNKTVGGLREALHIGSRTSGTSADKFLFFLYCAFTLAMVSCFVFAFCFSTEQLLRNL